MNTKEKSLCQSNGRPCIFITGASSGIGRATAELFAQKGWFVGICGRNSIELKKTFTSLGKDNVISFAFDIRDRNKWDEAVEQFGHATNQRMDVLFNNAGIGTMGDFLDIPEVDAITSVDVNLTAMIQGIYASLPMLKTTADKEGKAHIINNSSIAGMMPMPGGAVYCATKFGVRGLSESLNIEFAKDKIKVVAIMPYFTDTGILKPKSVTTGESLGEFAKTNKVKIYPPLKVAEEVWDSLTQNKVIRPVGFEGKLIRFISSHFPRLMIRMAKKGFFA